MDIEEFNVLYNNLIEKISSENKQAFIMGDFNIDLLKHDSHDNAGNFLNTNFSNCFKPLISSPTRITPHSKTLIDNIFTNSLKEVIRSGNVITSISDHLPQYAILQWENKPNHRQKTKTLKRDFRNFNRENFLNDFRNCPWDNIFHEKSPGEKLDVFITQTTEVIDRHAPIKAFKQKYTQARKPWITPGILKSINTRDQLQKKYLRSRTPALKQEKHKTFKKYKNLLLKIMRQSKSEYYKKFFNDHKTNLKLVWEAIHEVTNNKSKSDLSPKLIIQNQNKILKNNDMAEAFNEYYGSIAEKTKSEIPFTEKIFTDYLGAPNPESIFFQPTSPHVMHKLISQLEDKKANGPGSIPNFFLKMIGPEASNILTDIFNECLQSGSYPDCLKKASIKPLHKKSSKLDIGNYRPISLLSNINKLFEKLLHYRLSEFFNQHDVLFKNQFGFRERHNTNHAIIALTELVREALDNKKFAAGIFIDLKKAFDTVEHSILLHKLHHYGIRGKPFDLIKSYLTNRSHSTLIQNHIDQAISIKNMGSLKDQFLVLYFS